MRDKLEDYKKIADFYDEFASEYYESRIISGGRLFNEYIEMPSCFSLIPPKVKSKKILDIGCGIGAYSRILGSKGAIVTAIDISPRMIELAKENCKDINVTFIRTSFQEFQNDDNQKFDIIIGGFMMSYFSDLKVAFEKINNLMASDGCCILSMIHPIKLSSIAREDGKYVLNDYFDENLMYESDFMSAEKKLSLKKWTFSDISEAAYKSKLYLDRILEPTPQNPPINMDKKSIDFYNRCPSVLIIKLKKR